MAPGLTNEESVSSSDSDSDVIIRRPTKKQALDHNAFFLSQLPNASFSSIYKGQTVVAVASHRSQEHVILGNQNGDIYIRKYAKGTLELVRLFGGAHRGNVTAISLSTDGSIAASIGEDSVLNIFDLGSYDLVSVQKLDIAASSLAIVPNAADSRIVVAGENVAVFEIEVAAGFKMTELQLSRDSRIPKTPIAGMSYNENLEIMVSWDGKGMLDYWEISGKPLTMPGIWTLKSDTDLFLLRKAKATVRAVGISPDGLQFVVYDSRGMVSLFDFLSGKRLKEYNESQESFFEMQETGADAPLSPGDLKTIRTAFKAAPEFSSIDFDASGSFLVYPVVSGIKIVNLTTNVGIRVLGSISDAPFLQAFVCTGSAGKKLTVDLAGAKNDIVDAEFGSDIGIVAMKTKEFAVFSRFETDQPVIYLKDDASSEKQEAVANETQDPENQAPESNCDVRVSLQTTLGDLQLWIRPKSAGPTVLQMLKSGVYEEADIEVKTSSVVVSPKSPTTSQRAMATVGDIEFSELQLWDVGLSLGGNIVVRIDTLDMFEGYNIGFIDESARTLFQNLPLGAGHVFNA